MIRPNSFRPSNHTASSFGPATRCAVSPAEDITLPRQSIQKPDAPAIKAVPPTITAQSERNRRRRETRSANQPAGKDTQAETRYQRPVKAPACVREMPRSLTQRGKRGKGAEKIMSPPAVVSSTRPSTNQRELGV